MANSEQIELLKQGVAGWNMWREAHREIKVDLIGADLSGADLAGAWLWGADLSGANLTGANLTGTNLSGANLSGAGLQKANLTGVNLFYARLWEAHLNNAIITGANLQEAVLDKADLTEANLYGANLFKTSLVEAILDRADLTGAILTEVNLSRHNLKGVVFRGATLKKADLTETDFSGADLREATLEGADMVRTKVENTDISNANVFGVNVWDLQGTFKRQNDLVITPFGAPAITVDNIKVAQFVYLILNNSEIRDVLNTLTTKGVLILGRFTEERKRILDALKERLRQEDFLPILFDFERSEDRDYTETIKTLVGLCSFVIADVTDPSSIPLELQATVPEFQIPFVTIIEKGHDKENRPFAMMQNLQTKYPLWMLPTRTYDSLDHLMERLNEGIIEPAKKVHQELRLIKAQQQSLDSL